MKLLPRNNLNNLEYWLKYLFIARGKPKTNHQDTPPIWRRLMPWSTIAPRYRNPKSPGLLDLGLSHYLLISRPKATLS